jgi:hypothetical protein
LIYYGSGSSIFAESGSNFGSKLKHNFRRQFPSQIFLKSKFELNQIKIPVLFIKFIFSKVLFYTFLVVKFFLKITKKCIFPLKFLHFLVPGSESGFPIRIRIHKVTKIRIQSGSRSTTLRESLNKIKTKCKRATRHVPRARENQLEN